VTLSSRVSLALLATLALALGGLAAGAYLFTQSALNARVDERLDAAAETLDALVEETKGGFEWESDERAVTIGRDAHEDEVRWLVTDPEKGRVAASENLATISSELPTAMAKIETRRTPQAGAARALDTITDLTGGRWRRLSVRRTASKGDGNVAPHGADEKGPEREESDSSGARHAELDLVAILPMAPVDRALDKLLFASVGLSLGLLLVAALVARGLTRRALTPLATMAASASEITAADLRRRLPTPGTKDELDGLAAAFNDLLSRVEQAYSTQRRLAADASHQLRTPLTALIGQVEVALRRERTAEEYRDVLATALERSRHMTGIVEGLLLLARIETEGGRPEAEELDLRAWASAHMATYADHPRRADFIVRIPETALPVRASKSWLAQVTDALIENACKYSPAGKPITVRGFRSVAEISLSVEDEGRGVSEDDRRRVFEPFFRAADVRRDGPAGMGLGLSIAARLADAMGGRIDVQSRAGTGSVFTLVLPAVEGLRIDVEVS
jgi:two-component system, OmpR family, sensor kinase